MISVKQRKTLNDLPNYDPAFRKGQISTKDGGNIALGDIIAGRVGFYGGFVLNHDATVKLSAGDIVAVADSGGAAGTYRVLFPKAINDQIKSIDWFSVKGFTPRTPTDAETDDARVTGYNYDTSLKQWYITVQIAKLSDNTVDATPPANYVVGVRVAVSLKPLVPAEQV